MGKIKEKTAVNTFKYIPAVLALSCVMAMPAMADPELPQATAESDTITVPQTDEFAYLESSETPQETDEFAAFEESEEAESEAETYSMDVSLSLDDDSIASIDNSPVVVEITSERLNSSGQANVKLADGVLNEENGYHTDFHISSDVGIFVKAGVYGDNYDRYHITYEGLNNESFFGDELNGYVYLEPTNGAYALRINAEDTKADEELSETSKSANTMNEQQIKDVLSGKYKEEKESSAAAESIAAEEKAKESEKQPSKLIRAVAVVIAVGITCVAAVLVWAKNTDPFGKDDGEY